MPHLAIRNWEKYQHYGSDVTKGKRRLAWVKVYIELLDDPDFGQLEDASKWHVIACLLLAGRLNNQLPANLPFLAQRLNCRGPIDWVSLIGDGTSGWLIPVDCSASELLRDLASVEERRGEEIREDSSRRKRRGSDTSVIQNGHPVTVSRGAPVRVSMTPSWNAVLRQQAIDLAMGDWPEGRWGKAGKDAYEREGRSLDRILACIPLYNQKNPEGRFRSPEKFCQQLPELLDFKFRKQTPEEMKRGMA
jgi:hypothetical protein